jgi:hypothetical protein
MLPGAREAALEAPFDLAGERMDSTLEAADKRADLAEARR